MRRLYSLFKKRNNWRYDRLSQLAYPKDQAVRVFQDSLLTGATCLRPVEDEWQNGIRVYRPPVARLEPPQGAYEQLTDKITNATMRKLRSGKYKNQSVVPARVRTYSTGGAK